MFPISPQAVLLHSFFLEVIAILTSTPCEPKKAWRFPKFLPGSPTPNPLLGCQMPQLFQRFSQATLTEGSNSSRQFTRASKAPESTTASVVDHSWVRVGLLATGSRVESWWVIFLSVIMTPFFPVPQEKQKEYVKDLKTM